MHYFIESACSCAHTDPSHIKHAITFNVKREVVFNDCSLHVTGSKLNTDKVSGAGGAVCKDDWPEDGGAHFVDLGLGVLVKAAAQTIMALQPNRLHGSTLVCGGYNHSLTIAFSKRIHEALDEWKEKTGGNGGIFIPLESTEETDATNVDGYL